MRGVRWLTRLKNFRVVTEITADSILSSIFLITFINFGILELYSRLTTLIFLRGNPTFLAITAAVSKALLAGLE